MARLARARSSLTSPGDDMKISRVFNYLAFLLSAYFNATNVQKISPGQNWLLPVETAPRSVGKPGEVTAYPGVGIDEEFILRLESD